MKRYLLLAFSVMLIALSIPQESIAQAPPLSKKEIRQHHKKYKKHHAHHRAHKKAFKKHNKHKHHLAMHHRKRHCCDCKHYYRKNHRKHKRHPRHVSFSLAPATATIFYTYA